MRIVPKSAGRTVLEYDVYGMKGEDPAKIQEFIRFLKEVELEVSFFSTPKSPQEVDLSDAGLRSLHTYPEEPESRNLWDGAAPPGEGKWRPL